MEIILSLFQNILFQSFLVLVIVLYIDSLFGFNIFCRTIGTLLWSWGPAAMFYLPIYIFLYLIKYPDFSDTDFSWDYVSMDVFLVWSFIFFFSCNIWTAYMLIEEVEKYKKIKLSKEYKPTKFLIRIAELIIITITGMLCYALLIAFILSDLSIWNILICYLFMAFITNSYYIIILKLKYKHKEDDFIPYN